MSAAMPEWIKTEAAIRIVGKGKPRNNEWRALAGNGLETKKSQRIPGAFGRPPNLYRASDIARIKRLMDEARLSLPSAVRVVVAQNEGRI